MLESSPQAESYGATPLSMLARARAQQPEAWEQILHLYKPLVAYWCRHNGVAAGDIDDVIQEVFSGAAIALPRFRRDRPGDTFRGWLRGITRNMSLSHFRRSRGQIRGDDAIEMEEIADPTPAPEAEEEQEIGRLYQRALELVRAEFEKQTWDMFWRTVIEDRDPAAVAAEFGVSPAAVRKAKSRILRRIKEEVGDIV